MGLELNNGEDDDDEEGNATTATAAGGENDNGNNNDAQVPLLNPEANLGEDALGNNGIHSNNDNNEGNNVGALPPPRRNNNVEGDEGEDDDDNNVNTDAFYTYRYVNEAESDQSDSFLFSNRNHTTYVEEKALFCTFSVSS